MADAYHELDSALADLDMDASVHEIACYVSNALAKAGIAAPRVFCHGPKSAVFTWKRDENNFYLTISKNHVSMLASDPKRINMRHEFVLG
jgi:hypothetical protein